MHRLPGGAPQDGGAILALSPGEDEEEEEEDAGSGGGGGVDKEEEGVSVEVHCHVRTCARVRERRHAPHVALRRKASLKGNAA